MRFLCCTFSRPVETTYATRTWAGATEGMAGLTDPGHILSHPAGGQGFCPAGAGISVPVGGGMALQQPQMGGLSVPQPLVERQTATVRFYLDKQDKVNDM